MPPKWQIPASYCQPLGMVRASATLPWFPTWSTWLCGACANLPLPSTIWTSTPFYTWALKPCSPPTNRTLPRKFSLPTEQASKHDKNGTPITGDRSDGSLREVYRTDEFFVLLPSTLLHTFIPAFSLDNAYHFEKPNPLLHHMDDWKAILLNYFLINWLSCCHARSLKAESLHCLTCLLLRPTLANCKHL